MSATGENPASFEVETLDPALVSELAKLCMEMSGVIRSSKIIEDGYEVGPLLRNQKNPSKTSGVIIPMFVSFSADGSRTGHEAWEMSVTEGMYVAIKRHLFGVRARYDFEWTPDGVDYAERDVAMVKDDRPIRCDLGDSSLTVKLENSVFMEEVANYDIKHLIKYARSFLTD